MSAMDTMTDNDLERKFSIDIDLTTTIITGLFICLFGVIAMFIALFISPESLGSIAAIIASGAGLFGIGKAANTYYDTHNPEA